MSKHHKLAKTDYRKIWENANGEIPKGHHIHHIDGDPYNNVLENLICLSEEEHAKIHESEFVAWATEGGRKGGNKCKEEKLGWFAATPEERKARSLHAVSKRQFHLDSQRRLEEYRSGQRQHWTTFYTAEEVSAKISAGDPGKSTRGKIAWNNGMKMTLKNPEQARDNKSIAALKREKILCDCCNKLFDADNYARHKKSKQQK